MNVEAVRELARRRAAGSSTSRPTTCSTARREEPYAEDDLPSPRSVYALTKLAGEYAALAYGARSLVVRTAGLYGLHGSASKGGNFVQRMIARARDTGRAADGGRPASAADLHRRSRRGDRRGESSAGATASCTSPPPGACSWYEFTTAIMERAGIDVPVEPTTTVIAPGGVDRPLNGVLARPRADALGLSRRCGRGTRR